MSDKEKNKEYCQLVSSYAFKLARMTFIVAELHTPVRGHRIITGTNRNILITIELKGNKS